MTAATSDAIAGIALGLVALAIYAPSWWAGRRR